ncbi:MAG: hypothetical protein U1C57_00020 [Candidatus Doudnabacteria bacterium]|nr:hypothetical protein [Candidatus Doudnabacteria bacterium]
MKENMKSFAFWGAFVVVLLFPLFVASAKAQESQMLVDDLATIGTTVVDKIRADRRTPITVSAPMSFEDMSGFYGGYSAYRHVGFTGSLYPAYASYDPARQLPAYIQQELFEEYQRAGNFRPLMPGSGRMQEQLSVLGEEGRIGREPGRIGPDSWSPTKYVVVSSVGILEEEVKGREIRPGEWTQIARDLVPDRFRYFDRSSIGSRVVDGLDRAAANSGRADSNRRITGILYVAVVDLETRSILKSSTGTASIAYRDFVATNLPGYSSATANYPGAVSFARELVMAALYNPSDRKATAERYKARN